MNYEANLCQKKKSLRFLVSTRVALDPHISIFIYLFFVVAMKRCPIAAKIAGPIGILLCCVLTTFSHMGHERLPNLRGLS